MSIPIDIDASLLPWLGRAMKKIDYHIADCFSAEGIELTKVQLVLLRKLTENDGQPQHSLAFLTNRDKASLARLISTMENKNLVTRVPSKSDRRINHIFITQHGRDTLEKAYPVLCKIIESIQRNIGPDDLSNAIKVLKKVNENIHIEGLTTTMNNT